MPITTGNGIKMNLPVAKHFILFFTKPDMELFDELPEGKHFILSNRSPKQL
jgi:hypothetical protein